MYKDTQGRGEMKCLNTARQGAQKARGGKIALMRERDGRPGFYSRESVAPERGFREL